MATGLPRACIYLMLLILSFQLHYASSTGNNDYEDLFLLNQLNVLVFILSVVAGAIACASPMKLGISFCNLVCDQNYSDLRLLHSEGSQKK